MDGQLALLDLGQMVEVLPREAAGQVTLGAGQVVVDRAQLQQFLSMFAGAMVGRPAPKLSDDERSALWVEAKREWLALNPKTGRERPAATQTAYRTAWEDFRACVEKDPWRVTAADVKGWIEDLRSRPLRGSVAKGLERNGRRATGQVGLSEATVAQYLAAVSSFYSFCENYPVALADGSEIPLFDGINPVKAKGVPRPQAKAFAKAAYLDAEQLDSLLLAIAGYARESPGKQAKGLRDYALFFTYILTGGRSSEIRTWTWGGLRKQGGRWMYHWANKGKEGWDEVPPPAWQAVELYLRLSGRWGKMQAGDYIFTPLGDSTKNFGRAGEEWTTNRPLSGHEVGRCLKFYGARAGLDPALLHTHILRHSAYMLYTEGGVDVRFCSKLLHHSSLAVTTLYDHVMSGQRNTEWAKASARLKSSPTVFEGGTEGR